MDTESIADNIMKELKHIWTYGDYVKECCWILLIHQEAETETILEIFLTKTKINRY